MKSYSDDIIDTSKLEANNIKFNKTIIIPQIKLNYRLLIGSFLFNLILNVILFDKIFNLGYIF